MVIKRGEIWWADLGDPQGSAPGFRRPVLVIQANPFNASLIRTVTVVSITSNLRLGDAPGNVVLSRRSSGLDKISVVNVSQVLTIDKQLLTQRVRQLGQETMQPIADGLRLALGL